MSTTNLPPAHAAIVRRALRILEKSARETPANYQLSSPADARAMFALRLARLEHEEFHVAYLDAQHRLIECDAAFRGTLTQTAVYPREIVKRALALNAGAVVFAHNHPSGNIAPSHADRALTDVLKRALEVVDVRLLDHLIIGSGSAVLSFAEQGIL